MTKAGDEHDATGGQRAAADPVGEGPEERLGDGAGGPLARDEQGERGRGHQGVLDYVDTAERLARLWASRRRPDRPKAAASLVVAEWGVLFLVVSIGLFWAVGNYALKVGVTRGQQVVQQLPTTPDLVLFSEKSLSLDGPGVTELVCGPEDASYRYRYQGLKLVLQSGDQLLLLPAGWTRSDGTAIVLPRTDALRLEFSAPGTARDDSC